MKVEVLGSSAGGGLPQWNCRCENCRLARQGDESVVPRTQSSVAVSPDGRDWVLLNASPDLRDQVNAFLPFHDVEGSRGTRVRSVVLTDAEVDHAGGLLLMREAGRLDVFTTPAVREHLTKHWTLLPALESFLDLQHRSLRVDVSGPSVGLFDGRLHMDTFSVSGTPPSYSVRSATPGDTVGLEIRDADTDRTFVYVPGLGEVTDALQARLRGASLVMVDGTFWSDDELAAVDPSAPDARDMGHMPMSGPDGTLRILETLPEAQAVYVHINNTNPVLRRDSTPRDRVESAGVTVARDGMEFAV